jgi:cytochrome b561
MANQDGYDIPIYSRAARRFHWWVALLVLIQVPVGLYMTYRSYEMVGVNDKGEVVKGVWDGVTNLLYSSHKTIGLLILLIVVLRLGYRISHGAPAPDRSVPSALIGVSHLVHWSIYLALLAVPVIGYIGISYGDYLNVFGVDLPPVTVKDSKFSEVILEYHKLGAKILAALVVLHIGAATYHKVVRKDRVVERMLPKKSTVV